MKRYILALLLAVPMFAQRPALVSPVIRFSDSNGKPLVGGKVFSYQAGTTTPLATFTDSTTGAVNTNPTILDSTGSASIFLGANVYKLVLQNSAGAVQWTADNIAQGGFAASYVTSFKTRTGAVVPVSGDYSCAQVTGAICSLPTLYNQTVAVSGAPAPQEPIINFIAGVSGSVGSPTITAGGTGYTGAPSVAFSGGSCTSTPSGSTTVASGVVTALILVTTGSGCSSAPTATFSGGGGSGAMATVAVIPNGITCVDNPGATSTDCTFTAGGGSSGSGGDISQNDVTSVRTFGAVYQNTTTTGMYVSGYGLITGGSGDSAITCYTGTTSTTVNLAVWSMTASFTVPGESIGFACFVPPGYYYDVLVANHISSSPGKWIEYLGFAGGGTGSPVPNASILGNFTGATAVPTFSALPLNAALLGTNSNGFPIGKSVIQPYCADNTCASVYNYPPMGGFTTFSPVTLTATATSTDVTLTVDSTTGYPAKGCGSFIDTGLSNFCWTSKDATHLFGVTYGLWTTVGQNHSIGAQAWGIVELHAVSITSPPSLVIWNNGFVGVCGTLAPTFAIQVQCNALFNGNLIVNQTLGLNGDMRANSPTDSMILSGNTRGYFSIYNSLVTDGLHGPLMVRDIKLTSQSGSQAYSLGCATLTSPVTCVAGLYYATIDITVTTAGSGGDALTADCSAFNGFATHHQTSASLSLAAAGNELFFQCLLRTDGSTGMNLNTTVTASGSPLYETSVIMDRKQ